MLLCRPLAIDPSPPPPSAAHRYWRVQIDANYNSTYLSIAEIEMAETIGGGDLTTSAQAISGGDRGATFATAQAFDNNATTAWSILRSAGSAALWIGQDFGVGNAVEIKQVKLTARPDFTTGHSNALHMPAKWRLQYSDNGMTWTTHWTFAREAPWALGETRTYTASETAAPTGAFRYWRLHAGDNHATSFFTLAEIQMAASAGGANACTTGQTIYGDQRSSFPATMAFDGIVSGSNCWSIDRGASNPTAVAWCGQDFGSAFDLRELRLTARADGFASHAPISFAVECSTDGSSWQVAWVETDLAAWSAAEQRSYARPTD